MKKLEQGQIQKLIREAIRMDRSCMLHIHFHVGAALLAKEWHGIWWL